MILLTMDPTPQEKQARPVILIGFILLLVYGFSIGLIYGSIYLISHYESKWLQTFHALQTISQDFISLPPNSPVDPVNNGKIIYLSGLSATSDIVTDPVFVSVNTTTIQRAVEMYQWVTKNSGSGKTRTTRSYLTWVKVPQSGDFRNPPMQLQSATFFAKNVSIGNFWLAPELISQIPATTPIDPNKLNLTNLEKIKSPVQIAGDGLYAGASPQQPNLGDYKVTLYQALPMTLSVIGIQKNNVLEVYQINAENSLALVLPGSVSPELMLKEAKYATYAWLLGVRIVSLIMMILGIIFWIRPFICYAKICPLEVFLNFGEWRSAVIVGLILWGMLLFLNWFPIQPLLAIALGVIILFIILRLISVGMRQIKNKAFIDRL